LILDFKVKTRLLISRFSEIDMKKYGVLYCIACYFLFEGFFGLYHFCNALMSNDWRAQLSFGSLVQLGFLFSGIGLLLRKGWGWNFAIFFNFFILGYGFLNIAGYFMLEPSGRFIFKGGADFLLAGLIFIYLLRTTTKAMFPESPVSLFILGFPLAMNGIVGHSDNAGVGYFWLLMSIVGIAIMAKGGQQLRKP